MKIEEQTLRTSRSSFLQIIDAVPDPQEDTDNRAIFLINNALKDWLKYETVVSAEKRQDVPLQIMSLCSKTYSELRPCEF